MAQFVLVRDVGSGRVRKIAANSIVPEGSEIAGVYFDEDDAIAVREEGSEWFEKADEIGGWSVGPARFVYAKSGTNVVRLGKIGDYRPAKGEFPVAVVHGIDLHGNVLTFSAVKGIDAEVLVFLVLLVRGKVKVD